MSIFMRLLGMTLGRAGRRDRGAAFAEADAGGAVVAAAKRAEHHLVAVLEECALLSVLQRDRLRAARGDFQEAAAAVVLRARAGAGADEVADLQVAAAGRMVSDHLRHGPVDGRKRAAAQPERFFAGRTHFLGCEKTLERDVEPAARAVPGRIEI